MTIGVTNAMDNEHRQLMKRLQKRKVTSYGHSYYVEGLLGGNHVILMQYGIGKVNTVVGAMELIRRFAPDYVIGTGVAGGINVCLKVMDAVVSERLVYHDVWCGEGNEYGQMQGLPVAYEGRTSLLEYALSLNGVGPESRICKGLICADDHLITDRVELGAIKHRFPVGLTVDMESAAIVQACHLYGIPFLSFCIISDTPGVEDHPIRYVDFWGTVAECSPLPIWTFPPALPDSL